MSCQFNFFCTVEEMNTLQPVLEKYAAVLIGAHRFNDKPVFLPNFLYPPEVRGVYVALPECLTNLVWIRLGDAHHYVDQSVSPVIEASIYPAMNSRIGRARLYMLKGYHGRDGWVAYPDELLKLYRSLVSMLKRRVLTGETRFGSRCSPGALKFEAEGGTLSQF